MSRLAFFMLEVPLEYARAISHEFSPISVTDGPTLSSQKVNYLNYTYKVWSKVLLICTLFLVQSSSQVLEVMQAFGDNKFHVFMMLLNHLTYLLTTTIHVSITSLSR